MGPPVYTTEACGKNYVTVRKAPDIRARSHLFISERYWENSKFPGSRVPGQNQESSTAMRMRSWKSKSRGATIFWEQSTGCSIPDSST